MKILIVVSHPKQDSLNHGLKDALVKGVQERGAEIEVLDLYKERFDPLLYDRAENDNDPVILRMQQQVRDADGIIFVAPLWWANIPAMLKGFFDKVFTEGFAFKYNQAGLPEGILENKKALLLGTCDTPPAIARIAGTVMGFKSVVKGVLKFSGIKDAKYKLFGSVLSSTEKKREEWLKKVEDLGRDFATPPGMAERFKQSLFAYIKAVRLPLFSFVFSLILLGAAIGASVMTRFSWSGFMLACFIGLMGHAAVSLSNEATDEAADKINLNRTMFNGGTGLLAKGAISKKQLKAGWIIASIMALGIPAVLVFMFHYHWLLLASAAVALFLGVQYSLPPFRFSRFGLGEIVAFFAYGIPMVLIGFILETDTAAVNNIIDHYRFLLVSLPVSLLVLTTLCLTQIPDTEADRSIGKRSVSVLLGSRNVMKLCLGFLFITVLLLLGFYFMNILPLKYSLLSSLFPVITGIVMALNMDAYKVPAGMTMINIMGLSVNSAVLSGIIPAIYFFQQAAGPY